MPFSTNARIAKQSLNRSRVIAACTARMALLLVLQFKMMAVVAVVAADEEKQ